MLWVPAALSVSITLQTVTLFLNFYTLGLLFPTTKRGSDKIWIQIEISISVIFHNQATMINNEKTRMSNAKQYAQEGKSGAPNHQNSDPAEDAHLQNGLMLNGG